MDFQSENFDFDSLVQGAIKEALKERGTGSVRWGGAKALLCLC
jgi:hypothetical protein